MGGRDSTMLLMDLDFAAFMHMWMCAWCFKRANFHKVENNYEAYHLGARILGERCERVKENENVKRM